ncbi:MAG: hypothetical protein H6683_02215 [Deltaproteobacteria bacterium]|nr:hypothetical protein [Deltaproteobacteria bacterium]
MFTVLVAPSEEVKQVGDYKRGAAKQRPEFKSVLEQFEDIAPSGFKIQYPKKPRTFCHIYPDHWPWAVHYELLDYGENGYGVEIHLERKEVAPLATLLQKFVGSLSVSDFPGATDLKWDPSWYRNRGRLIINVGADVEAHDVANAMTTLILKTSKQIEREIEYLGLSVEQGDSEDQI